MKSLANLIPHHERLVTIEDAQELRLPLHANKVQMYYTRGGQGISKATAKDLLEATLRMYPRACCWQSFVVRKPGITSET